MPEDIITILVVSYLACGIIIGGFCAFLAKAKNRDSAAWFFGGLFFSVIALIAIAGAPIKPPVTPKEDEKRWICTECKTHLKRGQEICPTCKAKINWDGI
jgi:Fe2+ transport system protein B